MWHTRIAVVALVSCVCSGVVGAQTRPVTSIDGAVAALGSGNAAPVEAVDYVLAHMSAARADVLLTASLAALQLKRVEDAGFLFYAGQLRSRMDQQRFPPKGEGGSSPAVAIGALQAVLGAEVNAAVMRDTKVLARTLDRIEAWDVATVDGYDPGWEYTKALPAGAAAKVSQSVKAEYLRNGRNVLSLLGVPEYVAAQRELEEAGEGDLSTQAKLTASLDRQEKALERMCAIEKKMNIILMCGSAK
jgi:hypothetical protein